MVSPKNQRVSSIACFAICFLNFARWGPGCLGMQLGLRVPFGLSFQQPQTKGRWTPGPIQVCMGSYAILEGVPKSNRASPATQTILMPDMRPSDCHLVALESIPCLSRGHLE